MTVADWAIVGAGDGKDRGRFSVALAASVMLHLATVAYWQLDRPPSRPPGHATLSVEFRPAAPAPSSPASALSSHADRAETRLLATTNPAAFPVGDAGAESSEARRGGAFTVIPHARPVDTGVQSAERTPGGTATRRALQPGEVSVVLVIDDGGRATQIFWDQLPPMSQDQFRQLERRLRARDYSHQAGQAITETIDLLALLRQDAASGTVRGGSP